MGRATGAQVVCQTQSRLPFTVELRQNANDPPTKIAVEGERTVTLTAPDPALAGIWRARAETVEWQEPDGKTAKGLLMLPRGPRAGTPLPLVMTHQEAPPRVGRVDAAVEMLAAKGIVDRLVPAGGHGDHFGVRL